MFDYVSTDGSVSEEDDVKSRSKKNMSTKNKSKYDDSEDDEAKDVKSKNKSNKNISKQKVSAVDEDSKSKTTNIMESFAKGAAKSQKKV